MSTKRHDVSGQAVRIGSVHHEVHLGNSFNAFMDTGDIANNATASMLVQVGARSMHLTAAVGTTGAFLFETFSAPTFSAAGTAASAFNRKRSSARTSAATITTGPTVSTPGTAIDTEVVPAGKHVGGSYAVSENDQWVLAALTNYLLRLTNISGGSARASLNLGWYEPALGALP